MGKKGKRASADGSSGGADTSRRRSTAPAPDKTLQQQRVAGPAVLPPPASDGTGKSNKKRLELDLISKRVYQETILRCGHQYVYSSTTETTEASLGKSLLFCTERTRHIEVESRIITEITVETTDVECGMSSGNTNPRSAV